MNKRKNILLSCIRSSYFTTPRTIFIPLQWNSHLFEGKKTNPINPICILEYNIWKINYTTETFYNSRVNISVMYMHSIDHHVAKILPLVYQVVLSGIKSKEIINHLSFCFSNDLITWEGFRTRMFVAHRGDNRTVNAVLYCTSKSSFYL